MQGFEMLSDCLDEFFSFMMKMIVFSLVAWFLFLGIFFSMIGGSCAMVPNGDYQNSSL